MDSFRAQAPKVILRTLGELSSERTEVVSASDISSLPERLLDRLVQMLEAKRKDARDEPLYDETKCRVFS